MTGASGCALSERDGNGEPEPEAIDSELRRLEPGELAGTISCGETKRIHHTGSPLYRALSIAAQKGQVLDVKVAAPGHDARAWLTTASNATVARNDNAPGGGLDAHIVYTARSTSKHHVVFRETNHEDNVDFDVTLSCSGGTVDAGPADSGDVQADGATDAGAPSTDPFSASSCAGAAITREQAIVKIGAGNAFREVAPAQKLMMHKRSCNAVTGCSAWGATEPAAHLYYMASGGDNYNVMRPYNVHFSLEVSNSNIDAVVEDVSNSSHCPNCGPSGITFELATQKFRAHYGDAALFVYYPRWTHGSSGFRVVDTWAAVPLGPIANATMTVTDRCARATVLASDSQTEYGVVFHY